MKKTFILLFFLISVSANKSLAQNIDSLKNALQDSKHDTTRGQIFNSLGMSYYLFAPDSAYYFWEKSFHLAEKNLANAKPKEKRAFLLIKADALGSLAYLDHARGNIDLATARNKESADIFVKLNDMVSAATIYNNTANIYLNDSRYKEAFELFDLAEKYFTEGKDFKGKAMILQNKALIYKNKGNIKTAIDLYNRSLQIRDSIGDSLGLGHSYYELGIIHNLQNDFAKSKDFLQKSLAIRKKIKDLDGIGASLNELGMLYSVANNDSCLYFFRESVKYKLLAKNILGLGLSYSSIGSYYVKRNQIDSAIVNFEKGLEYRIRSNDKNGISLSYFLLGNAYNINGDTKKSLGYAVKAYELSKDLNFSETRYRSANLLSKLYKKSGDYKRSLEYFEEYKAASDSLLNDETKRKTIESQLNYDFGKKTAADSVRAVADKEVLHLQIEKDRTQKYALYLGLLMVLVFAGFIFNRFRVTQKQKLIIEHQKELVEEKHKEITDSINYAERIQRSFLASKEMLDVNLKDYFVFFKPKDIVSGDFYWASKLNNGNFVFSVADSTGHGVPGAIMSILNISSLEKSIEKETEPNEILNETRRIIIERLKKDGSREGGKDGMDCSLLVLNSDKTKLHLAAAHNPVWIVRNEKLIEFKADKMPVGKHDKDTQSFTLQTTDIQKGDVIYCLTDGFADQFGGTKGKKYMLKNLKNLFLQMSAMPMKEQEDKLTREFSDWKGGHEQVDDVCILGVRI